MIEAPPAHALEYRCTLRAPTGRPDEPEFYRPDEPEFYRHVLERTSCIEPLDLQELEYEYEEPAGV